MFRKIVTESIYSPALAARLGEYTKKLRSDVTRRQIGLTFVILAVVVQLFAAFFPPESANANNPEVFIDGGVQSVREYLSYYDQNTQGVKDFLSSLGITRLNIETAIPTTLVAAPDISSWFMQNTRNEKDTPYYFLAPDGTTGIAYYRPLSRSSAPLKAYVGSSSQGWFAIMKDTGNVITKVPSAAECSPQPLLLSQSQPAPALSSEETGCNGVLRYSLSLHPLSSHRTLESLKASDRIMYTLSVENTSSNAQAVAPHINLEDILEYSQVIDQGGGQFDGATKSLNWPNVTLAANDNLARSFIVRLLPSTPAVAKGEFITNSYDCTLSATFGNTVTTPVPCPLTKHIESVTNSLPSLSAESNLVFAAGLLILSLYFFIRSRQLLSEIHIIRHYHLGAL